jgi:hypothetical protein
MKSGPLTPQAGLRAALVLTTVEIVFAVGTKRVTFGSHLGGWTYAYLGDFHLSSVLVAAGMSLAMVPLVHLNLRFIDRYQIPVLGLWIAVGTTGQLFLHSFYIYSVDDVVRRDSYYSLSFKYSTRDFLSRYNELAPTMPLHAKANMPGKVLMFKLLELVTTDPRIMGILIVAISSLGGVLLYLLVAEVYASRAVALLSLVLYLFIPAKVYFQPLLNIISPLPVLACLLLLAGFLKSHRRLLPLALGAGLYLALCFDPLALFLGPFFVALVARSWQCANTRGAHLLWLGAMAAAGFLLVHLTLWAGLHFDALQRLAAVKADAAQFNRAQNRPYAVWLWANLAEFFLNAGALASLLCFVYLAIGMIQVLGAVRRCRPIRLSGLLQPGPLMLATLLVNVAALDLTGFNRGEVVRLWIFLMIFVQVVAADVCWRKAGLWTLDIVLAGSIIQIAVTISMVAFIL